MIKKCQSYCHDLQLVHNCLWISFHLSASRSSTLNSQKTLQGSQQGIIFYFNFYTLYNVFLYIFKGSYYSYTVSSCNNIHKVYSIHLKFVNRTLKILLSKDSTLLKSKTIEVQLFTAFP